MKVLRTDEEQHPDCNNMLDDFDFTEIEDFATGLWLIIPYPCCHSVATFSGLWSISAVELGIFFEMICCASILRCQWPSAPSHLRTHRQNKDKDRATTDGQPRSFGGWMIPNESLKQSKTLPNHSLTVEQA